MSAKPISKNPKPGRPATGATKVKPSLTIDKAVVKVAKKRAFSEKVSFSSWVESAMSEKLNRELEASK